MKNIWEIRNVFISNTGKAVLLASYAWGNHARRLQALPDQDLIEECLKDVARVHSVPYKRIRELYHSGVVKKWNLDPYSLGAFVFAYPHHV